MASIDNLESYIRKPFPPKTGIACLATCGLYNKGKKNDNINSVIQRNGNDESQQLFTWGKGVGNLVPVAHIRQFQINSLNYSETLRHQ